MGVFCTDRLTGVVFGTSNRAHDLLGDVLRVLGAARLGPPPDRAGAPSAPGRAAGGPTAGAPGGSGAGGDARMTDAWTRDAWTRDGYVPSWLARGWGALLFDALGDVVLVCRPLPHRGPGLSPVGMYRTGSPAALHWARAGEQLSVYDTPVAPVVLSFAQFCASSTGFTATTLRPPAPGGARSEVAVRRLMARSGLLARCRTADRGTPSRPPAPTSGRRHT